MSNNKLVKEEKADKVTSEAVEAQSDANKVKEAKEILRVQLKEHLEKAEYHKTMATKAQGALEVLQQLHPEEDSK